MSCEICSFVQEAENPIIKTKQWAVLLASEQAYLGRCYVTLERHCGDLAQLHDLEWLELHEIVRKLESAVEKTFEPSLFNWSCLMNLAYQNDPPNPHVHWHFIPKYNHKVKFNGLIFDDPEFGDHYAREKQRSMVVSEEVKKEIIIAIKGNL